MQPVFISSTRLTDVRERLQDSPYKIPLNCKGFRMHEIPNYYHLIF